MAAPGNCPVGCVGFVNVKGRAGSGTITKHPTPTGDAPDWGHAQIFYMQQKKSPQCRDFLRCYKELTGF